MNHVSRSHSQRTPRHTSPSVPLRNLTDAEVSEAVDTDAERREELLHASAIRFCPTCNTDVLTKRDGSCIWHDGPTTSTRGPHDLPASRNSSQALAPDHGSNGAGASESNHESEAA
jgi:hypothetical protein